MTDQPYRSPAEVADPPDRIVTMALRRYPRAVQLFFLAWFPVVSLITAAVTPAISITCDRDARNAPPSCWLDRHSLLHAEHFAIDNKRDSIRAEMHGDLGAKRSKLLFVSLKTQLVEEELDVSERDARAIEASYQQFFDAGQRGHMTRSLDDVPSLYIILALVEVAIGLFFVIRQRKIYLDSNTDTGVVHIASGGRFGPVTEEDLALTDVERFSVEEHDANAKQRKVSATMRGGETKVLFDATPAEAKRGAKFLEDALAQWKARTPEQLAAE